LSRTPLFLPSVFGQAAFWSVLVLFFITGVIVIRGIANTQAEEGARSRCAVPIGIAIEYARIGALPSWLFYPGEILFVAVAAFVYPAGALIDLG
jgi:hypothetical protein